MTLGLERLLDGQLAVQPRVDALARDIAAHGRTPAGRASERLQALSRAREA